MMYFDRTGIVIVNYNSASLALKAVASVLAAAKPGRHVQVVLVDNASPDLPFDALVARAQAAFPDHTVAVQIDGLAPTATADIVLISAPENGGFASGCNIGLRYLRELGTDLYLLLNPDTILHPQALVAFADKLQDKSYGLVGGTVTMPGKAPLVQALGGATLSGFTLLGRNIGEGAAVPEMPDVVSIENDLDYPLGAAMAFRSDFLAEAGLMDEGYFLYYEEADWVRAGAHVYKPGWAPDARILHHRGAVTGSHLGAGRRSSLADYHMIRSRMLYARKWCPQVLPLLFGLSLVQSGRRLLRRQWAQAIGVLRGALPFASRAFR